MTVKIFTGSGQFTVNKKDNNEEEPKYIQASGGKETIISDKWWEKMEHPCGQCKSTKKTEK